MGQSTKGNTLHLWPNQCPKTCLLNHLGPKWMSELDSERHFAPDCISRMSGSSSESPKPNNFMNFSDFGRTKRRATRFGVGLSKFRCLSSVLDLFREQNDEGTIMHIWIMMHHDASWSILMHHDASWSFMMHHDASWCTIVLENRGEARRPKILVYIYMYIYTYIYILYIYT